MWKKVLSLKKMARLAKYNKVGFSGVQKECVSVMREEATWLVGVRVCMTLICQIEA